MPNARSKRPFATEVSVLVGAFAVLLAIIHVAAAGNAREGVLKTIEASDTYNYMQAKIIREAISKTLRRLPRLLLR